MKPDAMLLRRVLQTLPRFMYRFSSEVELHVAMATVLDAASISYQREFVAGPQDRFDFLLDSGIVIEAKVKGSISPALSQCARYLKRDDVSAVVLCSTRYWAGAMRSEYRTKDGGKPIHTIQLRGAAF